MTPDRLVVIIVYHNCEEGRIMYSHYYIWVLLSILSFWLVCRALAYWSHWNSLIKALDITVLEKYGLSFKEQKQLCHDRYWRDERLLRHRVLGALKTEQMRDSMRVEVERGLSSAGFKFTAEGHVFIFNFREVHNMYVITDFVVELLALPQDLSLDLARFNDAQANPIMRKILEEKRQAATQPLRPEA